MANYCPNCGKPTAGANFCGSCGARLSGESAQAKPLDSKPARLPPGTVALIAFVISFLVSYGLTYDMHRVRIHWLGALAFAAGGPMLLSALLAACVAFLAYLWLSDDAN